MGITYINKHFLGVSSLYVLYQQLFSALLPKTFG